jgi:anti-anti-sigma factor
MGIWNYKRAGRCGLVTLKGPLNISRARDVIQLFKALSAQGLERLVVAMHDVPFVDGPGLAALIAGYELFGSNPQTFQLTGIQDQPRLVLELTGYDCVFEAFGHVVETYQPVAYPLIGLKWNVDTPRLRTAI